jgi:hypothetical protein
VEQLAEGAMPRLKTALDEAAAVRGCSVVPWLALLYFDLCCVALRCSESYFCHCVVSRCAAVSFVLFHYGV